jgi:Fe2+ or Zn2+ uptake regulation protein
MRLTKHRQEILTLLENSQGALSAAAVHGFLPHINLVTIYRGLDYFVKNEVVKKLYLGEEEAQFEIQHEPHHHAICNDCHKVVHFTVDEAKLKKVLALSNFSIKDLELTVRGTCNNNH